MIVTRDYRRGGEVTIRMALPEFRDTVEWLEILDPYDRATAEWRQELDRIDPPDLEEDDG